MYQLHGVLKHFPQDTFFRSVKNLLNLSKGICQVTQEVSQAFLNKKPVVALESTVITHGLPYPENLKCALRLEEIVRENKAVPATIGILDGEIHIGMDVKQMENLASPGKNVIKVSRRDLPYVVSKRLNGGTTVAATMILAHMAKIPIFVTGGIGGVHRGAETSMDISADLTELSKTPMTVISAGVKSILDIGLTLEYLETMGVCVATFQNSKVFPSFFTRNSEFSVPFDVENAKEAADIIDNRDKLKLQSGILLAVPIPENYAKDGDEANAVIEEALKEAKEKQISGKNVTPFVLERVRQLSHGASLRANLGLLENNAVVGSQIAVELCKLKNTEGPTSSRVLMSPVKHEASEVFSSQRPVVIGGSVLDIHVKSLEDIKVDGRTLNGKVQSTAGGVGRNVADCMTRLGVSPFFISVIGDQEYSETLLSKMKHVDTEGIAVLQNARTATCVVILDQKGECLFLVGDMTVHDYLQPELIQNHESRIENAPLVVIDGNIPQMTTEYILSTCSKYDVPVWFEPTDLSKAFKPFQCSSWQSAIAFATPNLNELRVMHKAITGQSSSIEGNTLKDKLEECVRLGIPLLSDTFHTLVVTLSEHGIILITNVTPDSAFPIGKEPVKKGSVRAVHYPAGIPENIVSVSGAGDCFAAGMISAALRRFDQEACIAVGQQAALLSLASHHAVPDTVTSLDVLRSKSPSTIPKCPVSTR